jgi:hypothetical protein
VAKENRDLRSRMDVPKISPCDVISGDIKKEADAFRDWLTKRTLIAPSTKSIQAVMNE